MTEVYPLTVNGHNVVKEFEPRDPTDELRGGLVRIVPHELRHRMNVLNGLMQAIVEDAAQFDPPLVLHPDGSDVRLVHVAGAPHGVFGVEVSVPAGYDVSADYTRCGARNLLH